ncbi:MAG TPA: hypothetical protein VJL08_00365 [Dehalococcoidia bacterium]|nr:hypothetical protein [Dehalococcoidia bacterium]
MQKNIKGTPSLILLSALTVSSVFAQNVREHTRPTYTGGTTVSESQAVDLTLTVSQASIRPIQTWLRTAGAIDKTGKILTAYLHAPDAKLAKVGQRVRAFPPDSKSSMFQAWITRVVPQGGRVMVESTLAAKGRGNSAHYVMEIVVERGQFLSVPNEAIIEEGDKQIVYVQQHPGHYVPQEVRTGIQGELYTQVLHGLTEGHEVVTIGSFFVDSEYKLKASEQGAMSDDHQHPH